MNQWCRIREGGAYVVVTLECGGLPQGSSAQKIAQHVQRTWERGQEAIGILRRELGEEADTLVPLVNGGINFSKLRGVIKVQSNPLPFPYPNPEPSPNPYPCPYHYPYPYPTLGTVRAQ